MFWLIETPTQLEAFYNKGYREVFIEVIPHNSNTHPILNDVSLIYIKPVKGNHGCLICIDHSETLSLDINYVFDFLKKLDIIYVRDKKSFLYYFPIKNVINLTNCSSTLINESTKVHTYFYSQYKNRNDINKIIPVVKHYEACENVFKTATLETRDIFMDKTILAFFGIEKNGIKINSNTFDKFYETKSKLYSIQNNTVYTQYNLFTTTRRPSNSFNGVNFAALNKENGSRQSFIPKNHKFTEIDISAYHPTLAGQLVNYEFDVPDIHAAFASMYEVDYNKAKELTFKQLYGGVFDEYKHLEFFQKTTEFINNNWETFNNSGEVIVPISGYRLTNQLPNMNPQKLFNYMLQNLETSTNVEILLKIHKLLIAKNTQIVLYTYDSFLFDVDENEEQQLMPQIYNIFKNFNLNVKTKQGRDYDFTEEK
jgi:hypothetical protein